MIGKEVRRIRTALGMSQELFARVIGYKRDRTISEIENNRVEISQAGAIICAFLLAASGKQASE